MTKYIPAVIGNTMIGACKWIGEFKDTDLAFDTWDEAVKWLKDKEEHKNKMIVK